MYLIFWAVLKVQGPNKITIINLFNRRLLKMISWIRLISYRDQQRAPWLWEEVKCNPPIPFQLLEKRQPQHQPQAGIQISHQFQLFLQQPKKKMTFSPHFHPNLSSHNHNSNSQPGLLLVNQPNNHHLLLLHPSKVLTLEDPQQRPREET